MKNKAGAESKKSSAKKSSAKNDALRDYLVEAAKRARKNAYAPYSNYKVGAAIATKSGNVYVGCNFENASYGACICAERNAIGQMIAAGEKEPIACAVVTSGKKPGTPCGICRQVLVEFTSDMPIYLVGESKSGDTKRDTTLAKLIPDAFEFSK